MACPSSLADVLRHDRVMRLVLDFLAGGSPTFQFHLVSDLASSYGRESVLNNGGSGRVPNMNTRAAFFAERHGGLSMAAYEESICTSAYAAAPDAQIMKFTVEANTPVCSSTNAILALSSVCRSVREAIAFNSFWRDRWSLHFGNARIAQERLKEVLLNCGVRSSLECAAEKAECKKQSDAVVPCGVTLNWMDLFADCCRRIFAPDENGEFRETGRGNSTSRGSSVWRSVENAATRVKEAILFSPPLSTAGALHLSTRSFFKFRGSEKIIAVVALDWEMHLVDAFIRCSAGALSGTSPQNIRMAKQTTFVCGVDTHAIHTGVTLPDLILEKEVGTLHLVGLSLRELRSVNIREILGSTIDAVIYLLDAEALSFSMCRTGGSLGLASTPSLAEHSADALLPSSLDDVRQLREDCFEIDEMVHAFTRNKGLRSVPRNACVCLGLERSGSLIGISKIAEFLRRCVSISKEQQEEAEVKQQCMFAGSSFGMPSSIVRVFRMLLS